MLKEVRDFLRDPGDLSFSLILPVAIFALMYGALGGPLFNATAYIVNEDEGGQYSTLLIEGLERYDGLTVELLTASEADDRLSRSNILMAVFIPENFSSSLETGQPVQLVFKQRGNGGDEGQIVASIVQGIASGISHELEIRNRVRSDVAGRGISEQQIETVVQQYMAEEQKSPSVTINEDILGGRPDPVNQFLPGILTMFVLFSVNMTSQTLVEERRKGTLERLIATRLKTGELFAGKFMAYLTRGFVQTTILLILAYIVFQLFTPLSFLEALVVALIFSAAAAAIGLIIGSVARSQNQATWISVFFTMLMVMISETFISVSEGTLLGTLSKFSINTYANDAFRAIINQNGSLGDIWMEIAVLAGVAVVGLIISRLLFRATQGGK